MEPWEICGLCHGLHGVSLVPRFPQLAGQRPHYIEKQFRDFHDGRRGNDGGQMVTITTEIEMEHLPNIASYFAGQPPPPPDEERKADHTLGKELFFSGRAGLRPCVDCHETSAHGPAAYEAPWLEAQHRDYLLKQLSDFAEGRRGNDPDGVMQKVATALTPAERAVIAGYLAATARPDRDID
jgi:cytochrome c553